MRGKSPWQARLAGTARAPADRLVAALADDILENRLEAGTRLPPHRELAFELGIGLGSVTKAYAVLERRGLIRSEHGRGTFVAPLAARDPAQVNLAMNTPPAMLSEQLLAETLGAMARGVDASLFTRYPPPAGHAEHRRLMARWLEGVGMVAEADRLLLTNGAQQALAVAFAMTAGQGGTVITEAQTYPGAISLAKQAGYRLVGLACDREGMVPDALDRALIGAEAGRTAVYITPVLHNPTTATMGAARRADIVAICRKHGVPFIEDDVYAFAAQPDLVPLSVLAPELGHYVNSLSKTLSPGLRVGALVVPKHRVRMAEDTLRATALMVSPLSCAVMGRWLADGTAQSVRASIRAESVRRRRLADLCLGTALAPADYDGFHVWLPMAADQALQFEAAAAAVGVLVTPATATIVDVGMGPSGIRLCLGGPGLAELEAALVKLAGLLRHMASAPAVRAI